MRDDGIDRDKLSSKWGNDGGQPPRSYSPKILEMKRQFELLQKSGAAGRYIYIFVTDEDNIGSRAFNAPIMYRTIQKHLEKTIKTGNPQVIMSLDMARSFDEQIDSGFYDPESPDGWKRLRIYPISTIWSGTPRLLEHVKPAGYIPHLSKLREIWRHPEPDTLPRKRYVSFRPRDHLSVVRP